MKKFLFICGILFVFINLKAEASTIAAFSLIFPSSGLYVVTSPTNSALLTFTWRKSDTGGISYRWLFKNGLSYSDPPYLNILSNNSGLDTSLSIRNSQLDSVLASLGVMPGDSVTGYWRVRGYSGTDSVNSIAPDRRIVFRRIGIQPLYQNFADVSMPPALWSLSQGSSSTQYWIRASFSAYNIGSTGSAMYDFRNSPSSTGPQILTSNEFIPFTPGTNYFRFNYAAAYYDSTRIDSCIIETSTNAGVTWVRTFRMYQSPLLSTGFNSTPVMSTVSSTLPFTSPTAAQWASKTVNVPIGTNRIRFVAKSGAGNNFYIDDITAFSEGIETPLTFNVSNYELFQNYPNPFNPATKINFSLPKQGIVTLKIYDMLGNEVSILVNEVRTAGNYSVDFNASNLASGVYFYRIESADFKDTKRMMLIK